MYYDSALPKTIHKNKLNMKTENKELQENMRITVIWPLQGETICKHKSKGRKPSIKQHLILLEYAEKALFPSFFETSFPHFKQHIWLLKSEK